MADAAKIENINTTENIVTLTGKITHQRKFNETYSSILQLPSSDSFSFPGNVEVRSDQPLGSVGELITKKCKISGSLSRWVDKEGVNQVTARTYFELVQ